MFIDILLGWCSNVTGLIVPVFIYCYAFLEGHCHEYHFKTLEPKDVFKLMEGTISIPVFFFKLPCQCTKAKKRTDIMIPLGALNLKL